MENNRFMEDDLPMTRFFEFMFAAVEDLRFVWGWHKKYEAGSSSTLLID